MRFRGYPIGVNPLVPALACLLAPAFAEPREVTPEHAPTAPVIQPAILPALSMPMAPLVAPTIETPLQAAAAPVIPIETLAQPQSAVPALPSTALMPNAINPVGTAEKAVSPETSAAAADVDWFAGAQMFDKALDRGAAPVSTFILKGEGTPAALKYAGLVRDAGWNGWKGKGGEVSDAALAVLVERGVKAVRLKFPSGHEGLQVAAEKGISPVNDLAYELKKSLGTTLDFMPERTAGAAAAFSSRENRLLMAGIERPDFFLALLHEARHAWFAALLREGKISLFHTAVVAKFRHSIAPNAQSYTDYMSFEELSNHAKTLKHMVTERAKMTGEAAAFMEEKVGTRAYQYADLLRSAQYLEAQIINLDRSKKLDLTRLSAEQAYNAGMDRVDGIDWFALDLPRGTMYFPVLQRETTNFFGVKSKKAPKEDALAALRLRMKLVGALVEQSVEPTKAYMDAIKIKDWAAAGSAADKLIKIAAQAERAWERP